MEIEGTQHRQNNLAKGQYIVLALSFQSRIQFELILVCGVSQGIQLQFFCIWYSSFMGVLIP